MVNSNVHMREEPNIIRNEGMKRSFEEFLKPQLIMHRFKSKRDFVTYFSDSRKL